MIMIILNSAGKFSASKETKESVKNAHGSIKSVKSENTPVDSKLHI
jgi:hypothetical protein